jgi:cyclophilin family peptidyl-prolyl cis-trans isomerase/HEAT repeat protein/thiol-disulfide isomerase/thioredoxin
MRNTLPLALILALACTTTPPPSPTPAPAAPTAGAPGATNVPAEASPYGMTVEEEAQILALEDRRELDQALIDKWIAHENPLHRVRIAIALGRIGPHTFVDSNNNRLFDAPLEKRGGVDALGKLAGDTDRRVREAAAFALGEIGDPQGASTLLYLTSVADAAVAAEAVEALSKLAQADKEWAAANWARYYTFTREPFSEGVRARAIRFLFRFDSDTASTAAMANLGSPSDAIRQEAAYALARRAFEPAREQLELLMTDRNVLTRAYATTALGRIGATASFPLIFAALGDAHPWVRTNAAVAAARIATRDRSVLKADDLPRIFAVTEDPDPGVRTSIIDLVGFYGVANETARRRLLDVFQNGTQWERELAAGAIAKHFSPDSEISKTLMGGELSPWMRVRIVESTAAAPHGAAIRARFANAEEALVRGAVLNAIPDEAADAEAAVIRKALTDPDVVVRSAAYAKYARLKNEPQETILQTLQKAEERERGETLNDARLAAIDEMSKIKFVERADFLQTLAADKDPVVRRVAAEAIRTNFERFYDFTPLPAMRTAAEYQEIVRWSRQPHTATIHMTRGVIDLILLTQDAPLTTWNFAQLAQKKYFDNSSFMRVVPNFVIQGGDPRNDMSGGPGYAIRDEINLQKYTRGAVGMALSGPDTGGSQFFITHSPQPHLDGGYTIFGRVYDGMNSVVDQTERGDRVERIGIDEKPPAGADVVGGVRNVSLPLEIGSMTTERLLTRVPEYVELKKSYAPDTSVVELMKTYVQPDDRVEVFMGTWCPDSLREVPKFLRILDELKTQGVDLPATFVAVDRAKQRPASLMAGKDVQKISTFIYYRGDRELGRIVERPQGVFEDDLLAIAAKP